LFDVFDSAPIEKTPVNVVPVRSPPAANAKDVSVLLLARRLSVVLANLIATTVGVLDATVSVDVNDRDVGLYTRAFNVPVVFTRNVKMRFAEDDEFQKLTIEPADVTCECEMTA
jgi:hypothetical protein